MFRKLPENAPVHRPATSSTPTTASPPPSKKQKTIHFPTPSRPRPPRQTQLTSFISTPPSTPSKRTPGPAPKSSGKRPKNASILKFFKPVAPGERNRAREDGTSDALFIAHGGYGLDVSDPEDEEDYEDEQLERVLWAGDEVEEGRVGVLELGVAMQVAMLRSSPPPPPSPQTTQDTVEATSSPVAKLPLREKMEAVESSAPPKMVPKFDPAALKLNFSSSMLFGKPAALPVAKKEGKDAALMPGVEKEDTCDADCKPPGLLVKTETISGDCNSPSRLLKQETASEVDSVSISDSMEEPETRQAKSYKDDTNDSINRVLPWKLGSANELIDEIEDPTQQTQRRLLCESREDEIQSTLLNNHVEHKYDYDGIEDFEDFDGMGFEAREEAFGFDPAMRGVEGGFDEDWASDLKIVMKPPDDEIEWEPTCPICAAKLGTLSEADANKHVNQCLDGKPIPPAPKQEKTYTQPPTALTSNPHSPLKHASAPNRGVSAFSKLMTANTETHQWNSAVRAEAEAKGKKAAERTCPFYKILFKGPIAVDAFRYGKVPGVNAYFLSHFHSDHYVGLSAKWDHGPIYCSRATANLVRAKLRVDPKWVVELPWEEWVEIPQTGRVKVRGLDANHCPGSMLYGSQRNVYTVY